MGIENRADEVKSTSVGALYGNTDNSRPRAERSAKIPDDLSIKPLSLAYSYLSETSIYYRLLGDIKYVILLNKYIQIHN
jgi:hypothetical protein